MRHVLTAAALAAAFASPAALAAPVNVSFLITATEGHASGSFTGSDANGDGALAKSELTRFEAFSTGTAFTGGPIVIDAAEALLSSFSFDLSSWLFSFGVGNGASSGGPGYAGLECSWNCSVGGYITMQLNNRGSLRQITDMQFSVTSTVPEPGSLLLAGTALAGLAVRRRRAA
jgi:opacity protein-like surface antigen